MSMNNHGASGYLLKASAITPFLPLEVRNDFINGIDDGDVDAVSSILDKHLPKEFPQFADVFVFGDDDESDCLECGVIYIEFDEEDLFFPKIPTPEMLALQLKQLNPEFQRWVTWG